MQTVKLSKSQHVSASVNVTQTYRQHKNRKLFAANRQWRHKNIQSTHTQNQTNRQP